MRRILIVALCTWLAFRAYAQDRPNVLIIVADDLGWNDVSFHGSEISTPEIDSMALSSIILDRFYVTPICSPTRAGVMTGKYPSRFGMRYGVCSPTTINGLPDGEKTIADGFEELGYPNRAAFGKWHLGHSNVKYHPLNRGFNYFYGHYNGAIDYFTHKRDAEVDWHRNYESVHEKGYSTDLITADVIRYLAQVKGDGPFLAYVAFNAPHSPMQAKLEELERYGYDPKIGPRDDYPVGGQQTGERERDVYGMQGRGNDLRQTYSAMVSSMSQGFGQIIDYLKEEGLFENTVIWFMSDNGGTYRFGGDNKPLRGQKHTEFEGGVRSVSFIKPAHFEGDISSVDQVTSYIDILPTAISLVGGKPIAGLDGIDIQPALTGEQLPHRYLYLGNNALVSDNWKLVQGELFAIAEDPNEATNLAPAYPDTLISLTHRVKELSEMDQGEYIFQPEGWLPPKDWKMETD